MDEVLADAVHVDGQSHNIGDVAEYIADALVDERGHLEKLGRDHDGNDVLEVEGRLFGRWLTLELFDSVLDLAEEAQIDGGVVAPDALPISLMFCDEGLILVDKETLILAVLHVGK